MTKMKVLNFNKNEIRIVELKNCKEKIQAKKECFQQRKKMGEMLLKWKVTNMLKIKKTEFLKNPTA